MLPPREIVKLEYFRAFIRLMKKTEQSSTWDSYRPLSWAASKPGRRLLPATQADDYMGPVGRLPEKMTLAEKLLASQINRSDCELLFSPNLVSLVPIQPMFAPFRAPTLPFFGKSPALVLDLGF
jgi:hypothetical protein